MKTKDVIALFVIALLALPFKVSADSGGYIVKLKDVIVPVELTEMLTEVNSEHGIYTADNVEQLEIFSKYIEYTETNDEIALIEGQPKAEVFSLRNSEQITEQWQLSMVNADFAWELETYGNDINVAVIDTGCNQHEDLNITDGYDFITNTNDYTDNNGHGTHIAGIISAQDNDIGVNGIAPKVNLYALKCVDPYYSSGVTELVAAIYAAVDTYNCKVINMSLGIPSNKESLYEAVKYATDKGTIIVAAVGNDGDNEYYKSRLYYPAAYDEVIGVGSVGMTKERSLKSQQNESVFIVAPGEDYNSTIGTDEYDFKSGTSQATPMVTATAAMLFSVDYDMTLDEFKDYIANCSERLDDDYCGYGLLNSKAMFLDCIKNMDYYISPINSDGVIVYNNTKDGLNAVGIFAEYDDNRYVSIFIQESIRDLKGPSYIRFTLEQKGISTNAINKELEEVDYIIFEDNALLLASKYQKTVLNHPANKQKELIMQKLARNGFSFDMINKTIRELSFEEDNQEKLALEYEKKKKEIKNKENELNSLNFEIDRIQNKKV